MPVTWTGRQPDVWDGGVSERKGWLPVWHKDTWDVVSDTIRETFEEMGFDVHVNAAATTVTIIDRGTSRGLTVAPVSNTRYGPQYGADALATIAARS